jgi:U3 small nucleolar RNA-associated protein 10
LNYQVLLKTRSQSAKVRLAALKVIQKCFAKLGEELLVLLPETVPFLAELMEDSDPQVEKLTQEIIQTIEKYLGGEDSIKNYL